MNKCPNTCPGCEMCEGPGTPMARLTWICNQAVKLGVVKNGPPPEYSLVQELIRLKELVASYETQIKELKSEEPYICKDCGNPLVGNYVTGHFHCTDVHPKDR